MTRTTPGRPRGFDREEALRTAALTFWTHGFEATSIAQLTAAMGINPPSLYGAFGDKKRLFREAVELYRRTWGAYFTRALEEAPTTRDGIALALHRAAAEFTAEGHPPGCLVINGATNCGPDSADIAEELRAMRQANIAALTAGLRADGEAEPETLARYAGLVLQGMSQQARDGATREQLEAVVAVALRAWPSPPPAALD